MKLTMFCYLVFLLFTLLLLELTLLLLLTLLLRLALLTLELVSSYLFTLILLHVAAARDHSNDIAVALEFAVPFNFYNCLWCCHCTYSWLDVDAV